MGGVARNGTGRPVTGAGGSVTVLAGGRIWPGAGFTSDARYEALAFADGRVLGVGTARALRARFPGAREVDLQGRSVIPGLIDAHNHAVRGGATWESELAWTRMSTPDQALDSVRHAVRTVPEGRWVTAIGGWHQSQFGGWSPSRGDLDRIAPRHPVYVQSLYEFGVANTAALQLTGLAEPGDGPARAGVELDDAGQPTGVVRGLPAFNRFLAAVGTPTPAREEAGIRAMARDYAGLGLAGVCDPGGFGMGPERYAALRRVHTAGGLPIRMRLFGSATTPGSEAAQVDEWLDALAADVGDEWLSSVGIGEVVHFGCHDFEGLDGFTISAAARSELLTISSKVAARGLPMHIHAVMDDSIAAILDCWEDVDRHTPIRPLRFSIAHADRIGPDSIARAAALGVGLVVDARLAFRSAASRAVWGDEALHDAPPLADILAARLPLAVGSDATRASSYNPWLATWWLVVGRSLDGGSQRDAAQLLTREQALAAQTVGGAWMSSEETERGMLLPGWRADLAVLSDDCFEVPDDEIPQLRSELTVVAGEVAFSSGALDPAT